MAEFIDVPDEDRVGGRNQSPMGDRDKTYSSAEIGALAHLYRGEVYRSTIWRTRLDATTNWSVVTLGVALSISYADPAASPAPLLLAGVLITLFLNLEARRYRYFNVWRARARFLETKFYAPMLTKEPYEDTIDWQSSLARDYLEPQYHISFLRAIGRRLRRNYIWIFLVQSLAYLGKILIHPTPIPSVDAFFYRMAIGPAPGWLILAFGAAFLALWASVTVYVWRLDQKKHGAGASSRSMG